MRALGIRGAWVEELATFPDERGAFHEWFRAPEFAAVSGHDFAVAQANCSVSARGALRGIHFADVPPGQAKCVTCLRGTVLDVVVDIRTGSPTFGRWEATRLGDGTRRSIYIAEGLGHAFMSLSDDALVVYLCSTGYDPTREHAIDALDPSLAIDWPSGIKPLLSPKDAAAPTLDEALRQGLLPSYETCLPYAG